MARWPAVDYEWRPWDSRYTDNAAILLLRQPVLNARVVADELGVEQRNVRPALDVLENADRRTDRVRHRVP